MALCDMCGKETPSVIAEIEGTQLNVCEKCSRFGKIIKKINMIIEKPRKAKKRKSANVEEKEIIEFISESFGKKVKDSREKLGLKQEDFAKKINEKVSVIHNIESEHHEPSIELARKLEKFLHIQLVEQKEVEKISSTKKSSGNLTIGDLMQLKK